VHFLCDLVDYDDHKINEKSLEQVESGMLTNR